MVDVRGRRPGSVSLRDVFAKSVGVAWCLVLAWVVIVASHDRHSPFKSRFECGTDPLDILHAGEMLETSTLRFVIEAHCSNARYLPDGRIVLRYGGAPFDVETMRLEIGGRTYHRIDSIGAETSF